MTVSRDVIVDLLPLYLAGEASPGSTKLVDEYLAQDPDFAGEVRRQQANAFGVSPVPRPDLELIALHRTKRMLAARRWVFGLAWFFTALSLSLEVQIGRGSIVHGRFLVPEYLTQLWWLPVTAIVAWTIYGALRRRARI